jgi:hypothetical protein
VREKGGKKKKTKLIRNRRSVKSRNSYISLSQIFAFWKRPTKEKNVKVSGHPVSDVKRRKKKNLGILVKEKKKRVRTER